MESEGIVTRVKEAGSERCGSNFLTQICDGKALAAFKCSTETRRLQRLKPSRFLSAEAVVYARHGRELMG